MPQQAARRHPPLLQPLLGAELTWSRAEGEDAQLAVKLPSERLHQLHVRHEQAPLDPRVVQHEARAPRCKPWRPMLALKAHPASSGRAGDEQHEDCQRCKQREEPRLAALQPGHPRSNAFVASWHELICHCLEQQEHDLRELHTRPPRSGSAIALPLPAEDLRRRACGGGNSSGDSRSEQSSTCSRATTAGTDLVR